MSLDDARQRLVTVSPSPPRDAPVQGDEGPEWLDRSAYPFVNRYLDTSSGRFHYVDEGQGEPVLFVHGTPSWSFEFRHLIRALRAHRRCIAPDLLGFGLSSRPRRFEYTPEAHTRALTEFVERLGLRRFALVVHDFGGPIGLPLGLDESHDVTALVVLNTWMWPLDNDPQIVKAGRLLGGAFGRFLYGYANASLRLLMPRAYGSRARLTPAVYQQYLAPFRERRDRVLVLHRLAQSLLGSHRHYDGLWRQAKQIANRPALIVWGMRDPAFGPTYLTRWTDLLPHADVLRIEDAGHWPHEEASERVAGHISAFLHQEQPGERAEFYS